MRPPRPALRWRPWLWRIAKLAIVLAVAWGVRSTVVAAIEQLEQHAWQWRPGWLALSGALYLLGVLPCAWFWHWTIERLGSRPSFTQSLAAYYVGHLGKYVPGKALVVVLRAGLIRGPNVDARLAAAAVFYETLTTMAAGGVLAALLLVTLVDAGWQFAALGVALAAVVAIPTLPPIAARLIARVRPDVSDGDQSIGDRLGWRALGIGWLAATAGWVVLGLSLEAAVVAAGGELVSVRHDLPLCTAAAALAVVAGFLSFLPGGAVVREAVILELLVPRYGAAPALAGALLLRLAWLAAELVAAGVLWFAALRRRP